MELRFMKNNKDDSYYIGKIIEDLEFVVKHAKGKTQEEIESDELLIDSIMFRIVQVAESNNKLSDDFKSKHQDVPWTAIKGMRNRIIHDYGGVSFAIVYDTVSSGIPEMLSILKKIKN